LSFGIVESLVILYLYFLDDLDGDGIGDPRSYSENEYEEIETQGQGNESERNLVCSDDSSKENAPQKPRAEASQNYKSYFYWVQKCLRKYRTNPEDSVMKRKVARLRLIDRVVAFVFFAMYSF